MIKNLFNKKQLLWAIIFALMIIVFIKIKNNYYCESGFPFKFWVNCIDIIHIQIIKSILGFIVDFMFWFLIIFLSLNIIKLLSRLPVIKYLLVPFYLTIISIFYYAPCSNLFCLFSGYGFPLGYFNNKFYILLFFIDFLFIMFFYFIISKFSIFIKKRFSKKDYLVSKNELY